MTDYGLFDELTLPKLRRFSDLRAAAILGTKPFKQAYKHHLQRLSEIIAWVFHK